MQNTPIAEPPKEVLDRFRNHNPKTLDDFPDAPEGAPDPRWDDLTPEDLSRLCGGVSISGIIAELRREMGGTK